MFDPESVNKKKGEKTSEIWEKWRSWWFWIISSPWWIKWRLQGRQGGLLDCYSSALNNLHFMLHVELTTFLFFFFFSPPLHHVWCEKPTVWACCADEHSNSIFTDGSFNSKSHCDECRMSHLYRVFVRFHCSGKTKKNKRKLGGLVQCAIRNPQYTAK